MTDDERDELERLQSFVEQFGVSEMTEYEFDRYMALLKMARES